MKIPQNIQLGTDDLQLSLLDFFTRYCDQFGWAKGTVKQYTRYIELIGGGLFGRAVLQRVRESGMAVGV